MTTLSPAAIYTLARNAGLSAAAATTATAVALAESGGRTDAVGDVGLEDATWGPSVGLWQIRSLKAQSGTGQPRALEPITHGSLGAAQRLEQPMQPGILGRLAEDVDDQAAKGRRRIDPTGREPVFQLLREAGRVGENRLQRFT